MAVARQHCPTVPASDAHGRAEHGGIWQLFTSTAACFCAFSQEQFQHLSGQSKHNLLLFSSAFKRSCLLPDHLASPARHAWWPQTLHLCSSRTWESRADPGERTHLQYMGMGKAPGSGAENEAGNHCNNFNLHGNNKKKKKSWLLSQLLGIIPTDSDHLGESLKTVMDFLPYLSFLRRSLL